MKYPLVSVIIPAYNAEKFLEEAINSVLNQTYPNMEIIVIDDGSTDNTKSKVLSFKNIRYIYQKHSGIAEARNRGIENAEGEYIAFLDADDLWMPHKTEIQLNFLLKNPEYAAVSTDWLIFENGKIISESYLSSRYIDPQKSFYENLLRENIALTSSVIAKKDVIVKVGMFDTSFCTYEDRDLMLRISAEYKFGLINEVLVKKRNHPSQATKSIENIMLGQIHLYTKIRKTHPPISEESIYFIDKKLTNLYISICYHYLQKGKKKIARDYIKQAIKLNSRSFKIWKMLFLTYFPSIL